MSARHPGSYGTLQRESINELNQQQYENSKQLNLQINQPPTTFFSLLGNGPNGSVGSTWPNLTPFFNVVTGATMDIDLSSTFAHYSKISITEDDTTINFENVVQNRSTRFALDITIDTATFNSLTFNPALENEPTLPTTNGSRYILEIIAFKNATEETYFVIGGTITSGGGGDVTFPINFPEDDKGSPGDATTINFPDSNRHYVKIILTEDITVTLDNLSTIDTELCTIRFTQGGLGNHTITFVPSLDNNPTLPTGVGETFDLFIKNSFGLVLGIIEGAKIFVGSDASQWSTFQAVSLITAQGAGSGMQNIGFLNFIDNEATPAADVSLYSDGTNLLANTGGEVVNFSIGQEFFGPWTALHDAGDNSLINLALASITDTGGTVRGSISGDAGAGAIRLSTASGGKFVISDVITDIVEFDDATGLEMLGTHNINMASNDITLAALVTFSTVIPFTPSLAPAIGFDSGSGFFKYNSGTTAESHVWFAGGELLASITRIGSNVGQISASAILASNIAAQADSILETNGQLFIADSSTDPTSNGEFRRNGTDVKVFTGASLLNFSDLIGISANSISQGDSNATITDVGSGLFSVNIDGITNQKFGVQSNRIDIADLPVFGITALSFSESASSRTILTQNATAFDFNVLDSADIYNFSFNSILGFSVDEVKTQIYSTSANTTAVQLTLFRDDPSPVDNDELSQINFAGRNSVGVNTEYGSMTTEILNSLSGSETGLMRFNLMDSGFSVNILTFTQGRMSLVKFGSLTTDRAELILIKEDASPGNGDSIADLKFGIDDSGVFTTYALLQAINNNTLDAGELGLQVLADSTLQDGLRLIGDTNEDVIYVELTNARISTDLQFRSQTGGQDLKIFPSLNTIGITFDNVAYTIGTVGGFALPFTNTEPTSDADADLRFGTHKGQMGISRQTEITAAHKVWSRDDNGKWGFTNVTNAF